MRAQLCRVLLAANAGVHAVSAAVKPQCARLADASRGTSDENCLHRYSLAPPRHFGKLIKDPVTSLMGTGQPGQFRLYVIPGWQSSISRGHHLPRDREGIVRQAASPSAGVLSARVRQIAVRFAGVVCPPEVRTADLAGRAVGEFELLLGVLPRGVRRSIQSALVVFDQSARLYPQARGRRFARLGDHEADAYFRAVLDRRRGGFAAALQRLKGLVVMCYYELPEVKEQLAYRPDPYIATVSQRRLASYGAQIRAAEAAALAPDAPGRDAGSAPCPRPEEA